MGAAIGPDGAIYGMPGHARQVVKVTPGTGDVHFVGDPLPERQYKYLRGIHAPDGRLYGIPAWADGVLRVDTSTGVVDKIGNLPQGQWMWHGGALGLDGGGRADVRRILKHVLRWMYG